MANAFSVTSDSALSGVSDLTKKLKALGELDNGKIIRSSVRAGIKPAYIRAVSMAPHSKKMHRTYTGRLVAPGFASRNVRFITTLSVDKQKASAILGVRKEAYYALQFVEHGTVHMPGQPWLQPAFYSTKLAQETALADSLKHAIEKLAAKGASSG